MQNAGAFSGPGPVSTNLTVSDGSSSTHTWTLGSSGVQQDSNSAITFGTGAGTITVNGGSAANTFNVTPSTAQTFTLNGSTAATQTLNVSPLTNSTLSITANSSNGLSGDYAFSDGHDQVNFTHMDLGILSPATIMASFGASPINEGTSTTLTFAIVNSNSTFLPNAGFSVTLPSGLVLASSTPLSSNSCGGTVTAVAGASSVTLAGGTVPTTGCSVVVNVTPNSPGAKSVTASAVATSFTTGGLGSNTAQLSVTGVATKLVVSAPGTAYKGTQFSFTVTAEDNGGNTITNFSDTVAFTSSDSAALLPGNSTLTNGVASFNATLNTVGSGMTLTATDTTTTSINGSATINVPAPMSFVVTDNSDVATDTGSLRYAINNTPVAGATITFAGPLTGGNTITLVSSNGPLSIVNSTTIDGSGAAGLTVSGGGATQVFSVGSGITAAISSLTVANGSAPNGAGIFTSGTLSLSSCVITNNAATSAGGGGLSTVAGAMVTMNQCTVSNNTAHTQGGGLFNGTSVPMTITNSTISGNSTPGDGGGIAATGTLTITNSTISGNSAGDSGGGIYLIDSSAGATIANSTISNNTASTAGGGGIFATVGTVSLSNTIVAGNTANPSPDAEGSGFSGANNLIGDGTGMSGISNSSGGNQVGTSGTPILSYLSALANNGGPTQTMLPAANSPALGAGNTTITTATTDQRGFARVVNSVIDIGAVQFQGLTLAATGGGGQSQTVILAFGSPLVVTATESCGSCTALVPGATVTFTAPVSGASATFGSGIATTGANGQASTTFTANSTYGSYNISASATSPDQSAASSVTFGETNLAETQSITGFGTISTMTYGAAAFNITGVGSTSGGTVTLSTTTTTVCQVSGDTVSIVGAGLCIITASQAGNSTYAPASLPQSFTVNKAMLNVTAASFTRVYDSANPALTATISGFQYSDTQASILGSTAPALSTSATTTSPPGAYTITVAQGSLPSFLVNYVYNFVNGTLTVNGAPLTVTASGTTRPYGAPNSLGYSIGGFLNGDTAAVVSGAPSLSSTASTTSSPGTYTVTATQGTLAATNYIFTFVSGTITVVKASSTLAANGITPGVSASIGQSFTVSFIAVGVPGAAAPSGTITYAVDSGATQTAVLTGGMTTVTLAGLALGTHSVVSSYNGDVNYLAATATTLTLAVVKGISQIVVAVSPGNTVMQGQSFTLNFTVTGTGASAAPTGTVSCTVDSGTPQTAALGSSLTLAGLSVGTHSVVCTYSGDANYPVATASAITLTVQQGAPAINSGGVVGAAGGTTMSPGGLISLYGANLQGNASGTAAGAVTAPLPTLLGGTQVLVNNVFAPLLYVSPGQINCQAPFETPVETPVQVVVVANGVSSPAATVMFQSYAPAVFTYLGTAGAIDPVITHANNTLVTPSSPAQPGETVIVWATGAGRLNNQPLDGVGAPSSPLATTVDTPTVTIGGSAATVQFSGLAPGFVGLLQINVTLPATLPAGSGTPPALPLTITYPGPAATTVSLWTSH